MERCESTSVAAYVEVWRGRCLVKAVSRDQEEQGRTFRRKSERQRENNEGDSM